MEAQRFSKAIQTISKTSLHENNSDGQLLGHFIEQQDESAFAALVHRHSRMAWGVCRRIVGHHQDAEDAFQAVFLVLARKAASIQPRAMLANWLHGVAQRCAMKARSQAEKRLARERLVTTMPEPETTDRVAWENLESVIDVELANLPEKYRIAIILCDLEGKTGKTVAQQIKIPERTLASRLRTARMMLAKRLARHGTVVSGGALATALSQNVEASVPGLLVESVIKTATQAAATTAVAGLISESVSELTKGVMKAMLLTKLKTLITPLLILVLTGMAAGFFFRQVAGQQPPLSETSATQAREPEDRSGRLLPSPPLREATQKSDPQKDASPSQTEKLRTVAYSVADLVTPFPGIDKRGLDDPFVGGQVNHKTREEWLIEKIMQMVSPKSWAEFGGPGTIEYFPIGNALVVSNTPRVQAQVSYLLETMRRIQEVVIVTDTRFMSISRTSLAKLKKLSPQFKTDGFVVLNDLEAAGLLHVIEKEAGASILQAPRVTSFPGQSIGITIQDDQGRPEFAKLDLRFKTQLATDLQHIDFDLKTKIGKVEISGSTHVVDGESFLRCSVQPGGSCLLALFTPRVLMTFGGEPEKISPPSNSR
jgi:RNA polymerase sigma factor (sigma-70 family)